MKREAKRKARSYKISDVPYGKALKRGQREKNPLAQIIEQVVIEYAEGNQIAIFDKDASLPVKVKLLS